MWPRWQAALTYEAYAWSSAREGDAAWRAAQDAVSRWCAAYRRKPRLALVKLGQDGHDRGARVVAAALGDAGFEVSLGPLFSTPYEAAGWAHSREPDIVGISTLAGAHATLVPALLGALRERGCGAPVVLGGIVPEAHHESLFTCGVLKIFGPDTPLDQIALGILGILNEVPSSLQDCCA